MDDDNEVLDWDEDDEQQVQVESFRKASLADAQDSGWGGGDADDDDAVSLGPDDDEHEYLPQDSAAENGSAAAAPHDSNGAVEGAKHSSNSKTVSTPKSATFPPQQPVQRENSSNSLRNDHSSAAPSPRRPQSSSTPAKLIPAIHGLPAKPIVASVPFFPPSHPSLIEATAMSNPTGKKNGIVNSTSSGKSQSYTDDSSLPPHWEVRQPRSSNSGIYYYNIKTQESTWSRPHHPSSRSAQAPHDGGDPPPIHFSSTSVSVSGSLSYDDRHYRPGENAPPVEASSHGKRPGNTDSWFGGESPPPVSPHSRERERSLSPPPSRQRGRDSARHSRSSQRPGRGARGANNDRDDISMNRGSVSPPRNWIPAAHVLQAESANANQGSRRQPRQQNRDDEFVPAESYVERPKLQSRQSNNGKASRGQNRDREQLRERDQQQQHNQNISTSRHRTPPPPSREREYEQPQRAQTPPLAAPPPRQRRSRFDRPAAPPADISANVSATSSGESPQIARTDGPSAGMVADAYGARRNRTLLLDKEELAQIDQANPFSDPPQPSPERTGSPRPTSTDDISPPAASRRKRPPLPPQHARFREMAVPKPKGSPAPIPGAVVEPIPPSNAPRQQQSPVTSSSSLPPPGPREQPPSNRYSSNAAVNANNNVPSGPRSQPQPQTGRGGAAGNDRDMRGGDGRRATSATFPPPPPPLTTDFTDEHHSSNSSRQPPLSSLRSASTDNGSRGGSGMYADRDRESGEAGGESLPRGPRAMSSSTSPMTPMYPNNAGGSGRDRSPRGDGEQGWGEYSDRHSEREGATQRRDEPEDRGHHRIERTQPRLPRSRVNDAPRPPPAGPHLKLSGTNSVPIGNRKGGNAVGPPPNNRYASYGNGPGPKESDNAPVANFRPRQPAKEAFERDPPPHRSPNVETNRRLHEETVHRYPSAPESHSPLDGPPSMLRRESYPDARDQKSDNEWGSGRPPRPVLSSVAPGRTDQDHRNTSAPRNAHTVESPDNEPDSRYPPAARDYPSGGRGRDRGERSDGRRDAPPDSARNAGWGTSNGPEPDIRAHEKRAEDVPHVPHGLPMKPSTYREVSPPESRRRPRSEARSQSFDDDRGGQADWAPSADSTGSAYPSRSRGFDETFALPQRPTPAPPPEHSSKPPIRIRRPPPPPRDDPMEVDNPPRVPAVWNRDEDSRDDMPVRPDNNRSRSTLLERLSVNDPLSDDMGSLRDRVQIPAKRDREEMGDDRYSGRGRYPSGGHDGDDGRDVMSKRPRKRGGGKPRRGQRRGGP